MISMAPSSFTPHGLVNTFISSKPSIPLNQGLRKPAVSSQGMQSHHLHFAGDVLQIFNRYKNLSPQEAAFKTTCDTLVWQNNGETLNVAEMIAFLCRIRNEDKYPGWGTLKTLTSGIPGVDVEKLEKAFEALHQETHYLGQYKAYTWDSTQTKLNATNTYWLREPGLKMLKQLYPNLNLPPKDLLFLDTETALIKWPHTRKPQS